MRLTSHKQRAIPIRMAVKAAGEGDEGGYTAKQTSKITGACGLWPGGLWTPLQLNPTGASQ